MVLCFHSALPVLNMRRRAALDSHPRSVKQPRSVSRSRQIRASAQENAPNWSRLLDAQILQKAPTTSSHREQYPAGRNPQGLSLERLHRLWHVSARLTAPFFRIDRLAIVHLFICVLLVFANSFTGIMFTNVSGDMMTSLSERKLPQFRAGMIKLFLTCIVAFPLSPLRQFARNTFQLRWSQFLTKRGLSLYFQERNFYRLSNLLDETNGVDNPDEVIQNQFNSFSSSIIDIFMSNLRTVIDVVLYSVLLIRIYPPIFLVIVVMVSIGSLLINTVGKRLVDLEAEYMRRSADFRFAIARVRIYAESIAFYSGDKIENEHTENKLDMKAETSLDIEKTELPVNMFVDSFFFLPAVIPLIILAPRFFAGKIPLGDLTKATSAFQNVFVDLSIFIRGYKWYASLGAGWERLWRYVSTVERVVPPSLREFDVQNGIGDYVDSDESEERIRIEEIGSGLKLCNVSVRAPNGEVIVQDLNLSVSSGERVMIVGRSGRGKTSLLRAIAGLWTNGSGTIERPKLEEVFFLPQRAYTLLGTLREQVLYPRMAGVEDGEIMGALSAVGLEQLVERVGGLDESQDWSEYLSAGESQRIAFARVVLAGAKLVVIDEGTSAMDLRSERRVMERLGGIGCAVISVGHRPSLVEFHDRVLFLKEDSAEVVAANGFQFPGV